MTPFTHACKARPLTVVGWTSLCVTVIVIVRLEDMFEQWRGRSASNDRVRDGDIRLDIAMYRCGTGFEKRRWEFCLVRGFIHSCRKRSGLSSCPLDLTLPLWIAVPPTGVGRSSWEGMDNCGTCTSSRVYSDAHRVSKQWPEWSI